jgi:hypothetical protein
MSMHGVDQAEKKPYESIKYGGTCSAHQAGKPETRDANLPALAKSCTHAYLGTCIRRGLRSKTGQVRCALSMADFSTDFHRKFASVRLHQTESAGI